MARNVTKICMGCGRTFNAKNSKYPFCSIACKKRYTNHRQFKCSECHNAACTVRNNQSLTVPAGCQNFGWEPQYRH